MAGRRQKGPSTEELLERLEDRFNTFKEEHKKELEEMKNNYEVCMEQVKKDFDKEIKSLKSEAEVLRSEQRREVIAVKEEQEEQWGKMKGEIIDQLQGMKVDLESYNSETEESIKASNEEILLQIEEARINIKNLDDKLLTSLSEISKRINDESTEIVANHDIFKDETETRLVEMSQLSDERYGEMCDLMKAADDRRAADGSDFREELRGLNLKIEEVLDSVGITIQEKLKETNSDIQSKMDLEAQEAQSQRAEIEFDVSGLKEKIDSLDQGLAEVNEKLHEFEQNKRNNLIFYGLNNDVKETPELLMSKIQTIIKVSVGIRRDIPIPKVMRMYNGE